MINDKIFAAIARITSHDNDLGDELEHFRSQADYIEESQRLSSLLFGHQGGLENLDSSLALESIILRIARPVLTISQNETELNFIDVESEIWEERLNNSKANLTNAIRAVGRIELKNHQMFDWVGTGWLVDEDIVITNRHVADIFATKRGDEFIFRRGRDDRQLSVSIDFLKEFSRDDELAFKIDEILFVEPDGGPDIAFFRVCVEQETPLAAPIKLSTTLVNIHTDVAVIGYPARDSRIPDQLLIDKIFGDIFDKKRLAPGKITGSSPSVLNHDCSTQGGNSGSVLIDLNSGSAVGIHFAGRFLENNYAVPATVITSRLNHIKDLKKAVASDLNNKAFDIEMSKREVLKTFETSITFSVPIKINVIVEDPIFQSLPNPKSSQIYPSIGYNFDDICQEITKAEDYDTRGGYREDFVDSSVLVPLPTPVKLEVTKDILYFVTVGREKSILDYEHFSVVMSRSRRLCYFSAVNIDGEQSKLKKRVGWRLDPRIPRDAQIISECYGNEPKFSRGHMTRRKDPVWGDNASLGNLDSMHVTNAVPQMQPFNAGIWLGLESYALDNARSDQMRISVFTGPVFGHDDPIRFGVKIPIKFWKVIAFVHDQTHLLCATAYLMSQEDFLRHEEFVFGQHRISQTSILAIEALTGLSFGELSKFDPYRTLNEAPDRSLSHFHQIQFI